MNKYPIAKVCPSCGETSFKRAPVKTGVCFAPDRICKACGTRYTPPTPPWAGTVFVLAGLLLASVGLYLIFFGNGKGFDTIFGLLPALMGIAAIVHGVRTFLKAKES